MQAVDKTRKSIREIHQELNVPQVQAVQLAMVLIHVGWVHPVLPETDPEPSRRLNRVLAEKSRYSNPYNFLAAPVIGSARRVRLTDFLILAAASNGYSLEQTDEIGKHVWQSLEAQNFKLKKGEQTLEEPKDNIEQLKQETLPKWRDQTLPLWQALGVV